MKYVFNTDENGYIGSFYQDESKGIEFNPSSINLKYLECYKLNKNKVVLDEEKMATIISEEEREAEINTLKIFLSETSDTANDFVEELLSFENPITFISDLIGLIKSYKETYKSVLAQRKQARQRIKELEK